jgi:group I intron endonuclease
MKTTNRGENCSGIYAIINTVNNKMYVGGAINTRKRLNAHFGKLNKGLHWIDSFQTDYSNQKESDFKIVIIEKVPKCQLPVEESHWILHFKSYLPEFGYNKYSMIYCNPNNMERINRAPLVMSEKHRLEKAERAKGNTVRRGSTMSESSKRKTSLKMMGNQHLLGHVHSEESRRKTSESLLKTWARRKACQD